MHGVNGYSTSWFALFLRTIPPAQTEREAAFVARQLPQPAYSTVLDLCCGLGRHIRVLAAMGYRVTGLDRDPAVIAEARRLGGEMVDYVEGDMRRLGEIGRSFDAVVCLWQSFGYFDDATNAAVVGQIGALLRSHGRLVLDIYHRGFFERRQGEERYERGGVAITGRRRMAGDRLSVDLAYESGGGSDAFEWRLYAPEEITALAAAHGLHRRLICANFDEAQAASEEHPRMQLVFEKAA